ncbi:MAG TPA: hypothetical protein VK638_48110, partial [Edaphobacter sp.]|nr:hypothetical protein [Edaphobacter sp.]
MRALAGAVGTNRVELIEELYRRYGKAQSGSLRYKISYLRKKYSWMFVVGSSNALKRILDVFVSALLLLL